MTRPHTRPTLTDLLCPCTPLFRVVAARPPPPRPPGGRRLNAAAGAPTAAASRGGSGLPQRDSGRQNGSPAADRSGWAVRRAGQNPASGRRAAGPVAPRRPSATMYRDAVERKTARRSEEHTSELQSLMRISYAVFCLKKKKKNKN